MSTENGANKLLQYLRTRRSIRVFRSDPIPEALLMEVIDLATWAPSAHNQQPWRFVIISTKSAKECLVEAMGVSFRQDMLVEGLTPVEIEARLERSRRRILEAPISILLCLDTGDIIRDDKDIQGVDQRRRAIEAQMGVQSVALAGGNLLLAAHIIGLGGVWLCAPLFAPQAVQLALDIPKNWEPQGLLLLGYPAEEPEPHPRKPLESIVLQR
jgi:F420 biosynthesis protein FbiB-like protein